MKSIKIEEASYYCEISKEVITKFIDEEWIHPLDIENNRLDEEDLARIELIKELKEEFGVNDESVPIILQLLDQLNLVYLEIDKHLTRSS